MQLMHCIMPIGGFPEPLPPLPYCSRLAAEPLRCVFLEAGTTSSAGAAGGLVVGAEFEGACPYDALLGGNEYDVGLESKNAGGCDDHWCCCCVDWDVDPYEDERMLLTDGEDDIGAVCDHWW